MDPVSIDYLALIWALSVLNMTVSDAVDVKKQVRNGDGPLCGVRRVANASGPLTARVLWLVSSEPREHRHSYRLRPPNPLVSLSRLRILPTCQSYTRAHPQDRDGLYKLHSPPIIYPPHLHPHQQVFCTGAKRDVVSRREL